MMHCPVSWYRCAHMISAMHCTGWKAGTHMRAAAGISPARPAACRRPSSSLGSRRRAPAAAPAAAAGSTAAAAAQEEEQELPRLDAALDDRLSLRPLQLDAAGYFIIKLDRDSQELVADFYTNFINDQGEVQGTGQVRTARQGTPPHPAALTPPRAPPRHPPACLLLQPAQRCCSDAACLPACLPACPQAWPATPPPGRSSPASQGPPACPPAPGGGAAPRR